MGLRETIAELFKDLEEFYISNQIYDEKTLKKKGFSMVSANVLYDKERNIYYKRIEETDQFKVTKVNTFYSPAIKKPF